MMPVAPCLRKSALISASVRAGSTVVPAAYRVIPRAPVLSPLATRRTPLLGSGARAGLYPRQVPWRGKHAARRTRAPSPRTLYHMTRGSRKGSPTVLLLTLVLLLLLAVVWAACGPSGRPRP